MATLYSTEDSQTISIYLYEDFCKGKINNEWVRYLIIFKDRNFVDSKEIIFNEESANTELILECYPEPEVLQLLKDIYIFLDRQIDSLEFEPIDEKDFLLLLKCCDKEIKVELILRFAKDDCKINMFTNKEKLLSFAKELESEYESVINGKHGLVKQI